jgi:hypothetical protein
MPAKYEGRPVEWSREASGVFFPEALETRRDDPMEIRELRKAQGLVLRYLEIKHSSPRLHKARFLESHFRHQENRQ